MIAIEDLDLDPNQMLWAVKCGIPTIKKSPNARGPAGKRYVTNEVAQTLIALDRVGLHPKYARRFIARFDPETDDLILSPRITVGRP